MELKFDARVKRDTQVIKSHHKLTCLFSKWTELLDQIEIDLYVDGLCISELKQSQMKT